MLSRFPCWRWHSRESESWNPSPVAGWTSRHSPCCLVFDLVRHRFGGGRLHAKRHVREREPGSDQLHTDDPCVIRRCALLDHRAVAAELPHDQPRRGVAEDRQLACPPARQIEYWFTYEKSGPQYDTPHFNYTHGGAPTPVATPTFSPPGGTYSDDADRDDRDRDVRRHHPLHGGRLYADRELAAVLRADHRAHHQDGQRDRHQVRSRELGRGQRHLHDRHVAGLPDPVRHTRTSGRTRGSSTRHVRATIQAQLDADFNKQKDTLTAQLRRAPGRAPVQARHLQRLHDNVGFYTSVAGLGQNPDDVMINGDITVDAFNASDKGVALQNFWRSAENLAVNPAGGTEPLGGRAGRAVPPDGRPRQPGAVPGELRLRQRRLHRRHEGVRPDGVDLPAAVVHQGLELRQLGRRRVEHGVLRFTGRAGEHVPQPAGDDAGDHPGLARRALPLRRRHRQVPGVPALAAHQRVRRRAGRTAAPRARRCR